MELGLITLVKVSVTVKGGVMVVGTRLRTSWLVAATKDVKPVKPLWELRLEFVTSNPAGIVQLSPCSGSLEQNIMSNDPMVELVLIVNVNV
jgi:hypothetical protein